mmetsp:Transcript_9233/g.30481  ORF Transcript_9233/g.30481 Transcript_9233/m.30481 type:complete len:225 (+) Transcript_9233:1099-1773(+)
MTVVFTLVIIEMELVMPCEPIPESLTPWNGKWSGPRAGAPFTCTVPVSIASEMRSAALMSCVKTHPWRPYLLWLTKSSASASERTRTTGTTGPNGSSHASRISGRTWSTSTGQMRFPSRLKSCKSFAPFCPASCTSASIKSALCLDTTAVMSGLSSGCPTLSLLTFSATAFTSSSAISSNTTTTFTAVQRCPEYEKPPLMMLDTASARSASGSTTHASLPPSSI